MSTSARWTWLVYMAGDNNLEGAGRDDLKEMQQVGSTADVNVLVQFDTEEDKTTRYRVERKALKTLQTMKGVNCGDPEVLADFIRWGIANYPADHILVDVWNHGGGWENLPPDYDYSQLRGAQPQRAARLKRARRAIFKTTIAAIAKPRNRAISSSQPAASLRTAKLCCPGSTMTSRRSFDTSIPQNESIAIFVPLPC